MNTFHRDRATGIGGSDIPVIMGVSPFGRTPLDIWKDKLGYGEPVTETAPMKRGTRLEPIAAEEFTKATGRSLSTGVELMRHPYRPYMIGHVDAKQTDPEGALSGILEIKVPNIQTYLKYKREGLADYITLQLQHYLSVSGAAWGTCWIWNAELWEGQHVDMQRDEQIINLIYDRAEKFWACVESKTPPEGEASKVIELPKSSGKLVQFDGDKIGAAWQSAVRDLRMATELKDESEKIMETAKARVIGLLDAAGATAGEGHGARVYWQEQKGRSSFDKESVLTDMVQAKELLKLMRGYMPFDFLQTHKDFLERIDSIITKPTTEKAYQKVGKPFKSFRSYFTNRNQLEG